MNRLSELFWMIKYRILESASRMVVEEYEDGIDAVLIPTLAFLTIACSLYAAFNLSHTGVRLFFGVFVAVLTPMVVVSVIASTLWYFNPDPVGGHV